MTWATVLTPAFQSGLLEVDNTHDVRATVLTPAFQSGLPNVDDTDDMGRQYLRLRSGRDRQKCVIPATLAHNPSRQMGRCIATSVSITPGLRHKGSPSPSLAALTRGEPIDNLKVSNGRLVLFYGALASGARRFLVVYVCRELRL